jgi:hypothetical protein
MAFNHSLTDREHRSIPFVDISRELQVSLADVRAMSSSVGQRTFAARYKLPANIGGAMYPAPIQTI